LRLHLAKRERLRAWSLIADYTSALHLIPVGSPANVKLSLAVSISATMLALRSWKLCLGLLSR
jgi:hypothetical protein